MIELLRWTGISSKFRASKSVSCMHKDGTVYIFDTQLMHRGGYEAGLSRRVIFHLEFSIPEKHEFLDGPIGTSRYNEFYFDEKLLDIESFRSLLDLNRVKAQDDKSVFFLYHNPKR